MRSSMVKGEGDPKSFGHAKIGKQSSAVFFTEKRNKWANNYETYAAIAEFFPHHFDGPLQHADEFREFERLPPKAEWVATMRQGIRWRK